MQFRDKIFAEKGKGRRRGRDDAEEWSGVDDDVDNDDDGVVNDDDDDYSLQLLSPAKLKLRLRCALSICQK